MTQESRDVVLDDRVYAYLRTPDECSPNWVRIAMLQHRMAGDSGPVHGASELVIVWNPHTQQLEPDEIEFTALRNHSKPSPTATTTEAGQLSRR